MQWHQNNALKSEVTHKGCSALLPLLKTENQHQNSFKDSALIQDILLTAPRMERAENGLFSECTHMPPDDFKWIVKKMSWKQIANIMKDAQHSPFSQKNPTSYITLPAGLWRHRFNLIWPIGLCQPIRSTNLSCDQSTLGSGWAFVFRRIVFLPKDLRCRHGDTGKEDVAAGHGQGCRKCWWAPPSPPASPGQSTGSSGHWVSCMKRWTLHQGHNNTIGLQHHFSVCPRYCFPLSSKGNRHNAAKAQCCFSLETSLQIR